MKVGVLVSGGGTNLQALIDANMQYADIVTVISNNPNAYALQRAAKHNIPAAVITKKEHGSNFCDQLISHLKNYEVEVVVLAGFMSILESKFLDAFKNKIINVHPSLIPAFCGLGYYGLRVHQAVLDYGVRITGATVHFVNEQVDGGAIILQKAVDVSADDTAESLQQRVMQQAEWDILPKACEIVCSGKYLLEGRRIKLGVEL